MKRPFLANIHIPKCGGTTFLEVLQRNFGPKYDSSYGHIWRPFFTAEQIEKFIVQDHRFEVFSSHEMSLDLPFSADHVALTCTISLRDPLQRTISHYFFERQRGTTKFRDTLDLSLDDFLEQVIDEKDHWLVNYQTKHLLRNSSLSNAKDIVKLAERTKIFPVVLERMPESMVMLERRLPHWFKDASFKATNQSRHTEAPDKGLMTELLKRNDQDAILLEWGNQELDRFASENPEEHGRWLARFHSRCRSFERKAAVRDVLRAMVKRVRNR